jgi:hypothetical protein
MIREINPIVVLLNIKGCVSSFRLIKRRLDREELKTIRKGGQLEGLNAMANYLYFIIYFWVISMRNLLSLYLFLLILFRFYTLKLQQTESTRIVFTILHFVFLWRSLGTF